MVVVALVDQVVQLLMVVLVVVLVVIMIVTDQEQLARGIVALQILIHPKVLVVAVVLVKWVFNHPKLKVVQVVMDYKMISVLVLMFGMLVVEEAHVGPVVLVVLEAKAAAVTALAQIRQLLVHLIPVVVVVVRRPMLEESLAALE